MSCRPVHLPFMALCALALVAAAAAADVPQSSPSPAAPVVAPRASNSGFPAAGHSGVPAAGASSAPGAGPTAAPSSSPAGRFRFHRPGTDVDGDLLTGNLASDVYVLRGNVTLHSDPSVDREIAAASESTEPLTVTADEIDVDKGGLTYTAKGNVHFSQGTRSGRADLAMLDEFRHTIDLIGNANVYDLDRRAAAQKLHYNMLDKGFLGSGNVRLFEPLPTPNPDTIATPAPKRKRRLPI